GKDLIVNLDLQKDMIPLTSDGEYFFKGNQIHRLSERQRRKILPLYNEIIAKRNGILRVSEEYKESFISEVLPNVKNVVNLNIDEKVEEAIYNPELKAEIYFDKEGDMIIG